MHLATQYNLIHLVSQWVNIVRNYMGGRENSHFQCGLGTRPLLLRVEGFNPDHIKAREDGSVCVYVTIRLRERDRNKPWESFTSVLETLKNSFACMQLFIYAAHQCYVCMHLCICLHVPPCRHSLQN